MFCSNCGAEQPNESKFCQKCGHKINRKDQKTRDLALITKADAKKYLIRLKILFWAVFLSIGVIRALGESKNELAAILFFPYLGLVIYFIIFCVKILKAEKLSKANALWCVIFAPISWLYFYPLITNPLKIILGEKEPPAVLSKEQVAENTKKSRRYIKIALIVFAVVCFILIAALLIFYNSGNSPSPTSSPPSAPSRIIPLKFQ